MATQLLLLDPAETSPAPARRRTAAIPMDRPARQAPLPQPPAKRPADWRLDEHTRELGRRGIEEARRALAAAARRVDAA